jgi:AraC-like DNA-binding protein
MNKKQKYSSRQIMLDAEYEIFSYKDTYLQEVQLHHHDFYEVYFFISGNVKYLIEGNVYRLQPGDIVVINSNQLHQPIFEDHNKPYERIVLWIDKRFIESLCTTDTNLARCFEDENLKNRNVLTLPLEDRQNVKLTFMKLLQCKGEDNFGSDIDYKIYMTEILLVLNRLQIQTERNFVQTKIETKNNTLIQSIITFIEEHIDEEIPLETLTKEFYISKYYLSREFKKHTGTTIHRYSIQKKLIAAKELILQGIPLIEVYKRIGFGDYCNFLRAFKKEYGITPKEFYQFMISKESS